jgi:hypothetical protein|tara:strand:+ start:2887 stop:3132 length:246 start_codon:yes stop_codon:yes gene_type:complete
MKKITPRETKSYNDWMDYIHDCISNKKQPDCEQRKLNEYHRLRNIKYHDLVKRGVIEDTDDNFEKFDVTEYEYHTSSIIWE